MYVCVYIYMYNKICACVYVCVYIYTCIYTYIYLYIYTCVSLVIWWLCFLAKSVDAHTSLLDWMSLQDDFWWVMVFISFDVSRHLGKSRIVICSEGHDAPSLLPSWWLTNLCHPGQSRDTRRQLNLIFVVCVFNESNKLDLLPNFKDFPLRENWEIVGPTHEHTHEHTHTHTCTYTHTYTHTRRHTRTHAHAHTHTHRQTHAHVHIYQNIPSANVTKPPWRGLAFSLPRCELCPWVRKRKHAGTDLRRSAEGRQPNINSLGWSVSPAVLMYTTHIGTFATMHAQATFQHM